MANGESILLTALKKITGAFNQKVTTDSVVGLKKIVDPVARELLGEEFTGDADQGLEKVYDHVNKIRELLTVEEVPPAMTNGIIALTEARIIPQIMTAIIQPLVESKQGQDARKAFRPNLPQEREIITAYFRKLIDKDTLADKLGRLGYKDEDIQLITTVSKQIPTARDIIAFAVREVYSPEIADQFGQYEGAEKVLNEAKEDIEAAGMEPDVFRKYWAAHWQLPSILQGFEMFQRGVIDQSTLTNLMVAADIMPFWRDKLTQIAYNPYTRVDVRRMHKIGVLTEEQVKRAYMDLGYNEERAQKMLEFTIEYNKDPELVDQTLADQDLEQQKQLTRSDILNSYKIKLIGKQDAAQMLQDIGYSAEHAAFYLAREDMRLEEQRTSNIIDNYKDLYVNGIWTEQKVRAQLGELGLPDSTMSQYLEEWTIEKQTAADLPTKAELLRWFKKDLISEDQTREELSRHHYDDKYIDLYIEETKMSKGSDEE